MHPVLRHASAHYCLPSTSRRIFNAKVTERLAGSPPKERMLTNADERAGGTAVQKQQASSKDQSFAYFPASQSVRNCSRE